MHQAYKMLREATLGQQRPANARKGDIPVKAEGGMLRFPPSALTEMSLVFVHGAKGYSNNRREKLPEARRVPESPRKIPRRQTIPESYRESPAQTAKKTLGDA